MLQSCLMLLLLAFSLMTLSSSFVSIFKLKQGIEVAQNSCDQEQSDNEKVEEDIDLYYSALLAIYFYPFEVRKPVHFYTTSLPYLTYDTVLLPPEC
jgi:hypothetical protein